MTFRVEFRARRPVLRGRALADPAPVGDLVTDVIEACALLAQARAGDLVLTGFGRDPWPLDVSYDMSAFVEHLPALLDGVRAGDDVEVDLYPQGVECTLAFTPSGDVVEIRCASRTAWQPAPEVERVARDDLLDMLDRFATAVATSLAAVAPRLAAGEPFRLWLPDGGGPADGRLR